MRVHVEVVRSNNSLKNNEVSKLVKKELNSHNEIPLNSTWSVAECPVLKYNVQDVFICELENSKEFIGEEIDTVKTGDVQIKVHTFQLFDGGCHESSFKPDDVEGQENSVCAATYWTLPTKEFHGLWNSLIYDSKIKERLLRYAWTMVQYSLARVDSTVISCNRIVLLHGPPGTGKTSLCRAIAQKLSVRLSENYRHTVLVEINAHSLFSKYFSESGKLVSQMFMKLKECVSDPGTLVCILLDEVESLAHSRSAAASSAEPSDSVRVVNALLTHLDHIKQSPNVLILSTSNISGIVDSAFLDRADISFYIPHPSAFAIYTIYYSCLKELIRVCKVEGPVPIKLKNQKEFDSVCSSGDSPNALLKSLSILSEGLSGRTLRKVPILVHSYCLPVTELVPLPIFVKAMQTVAIEIKIGKNSKSTLLNDII